MAEEEDADYRRRLSEVLLRHGFDWVVQQAEIQFAEGKPTSKEVSERRYLSPTLDSEFIVRAPSSRRASLITSEPYSETERLEILLQAINAAVVERARLEEAILHQLTNVSAIDFQPETAGVRQAHRLDSARLPNARDLQQRGDTALNELRGRDRGGP